MNAILKEIFFVVDCGEPLGMENRKIPDSALTASSFHRNGLDPRFAHLHSATSWSAGINNSSQWLQVDLGMETAIKKIATQSKRNSLHWVASYEILSRVDGGHWELYQEDNAVKVSQCALADPKFNIVNGLNPSHGTFRYFIYRLTEKKMSFWSISQYCPFKLRYFQNSPLNAVIFICI